MKIGQAFAQRGELEEAREQYQAALSIEEAIVKQEPENDTYQSNLARGYNLLANLLVRDKKPDQALELYKKALLIRERLFMQSAGW